jgi:hypothetical protein
MKVKKLAMMMSVAALAAGVCANDANKKVQLTDRDKAVLRLTSAAAAMRTSAAEKGGLTRVLEKSGSPAFREKWAKEVEPLIGKKEQIEWADFFSSAIIWIGAVKDSRGVAGFYSPWADGVVLVLLEAGEKHVQLIDFSVVSGESFRGGVSKNAPASASFSLYPAKEPPIIALARLYDPSCAEFTKLYPLKGGETVLLPPLLAMRMGHPNEELMIVKARMLVRMKMFSDYLSEANRSWAKTTGQLMSVLRKGDVAAIQAALSVEQNAGIVNNLCGLPAAWRGTLSPNYFIPAKDGAIVGFVSPEAPRWVVVAVYKGVATAERNARIELLDLDSSDKVIQLCANGGVK